LSSAVGDEGGFAPSVSSNERALEIIVQAIELAGYRSGNDISIAFEAAASESYDRESNSYVFQTSDKTRHSSTQMIEFCEKLAETFPIVSIEDGLSQNVGEGWAKLTQKRGYRIQIVGNDFFVTNSKYLKRGIEEKSANAILRKADRIGILAQTFDA
jgi:enolase